MYFHCHIYIYASMSEDMLEIAVSTVCIIEQPERNTVGIKSHKFVSHHVVKIKSTYPRVGCIDNSYITTYLIK